MLSENDLGTVPPFLIYSVSHLLKGITLIAISLLTYIVILCDTSIIALEQGHHFVCFNPLRAF